MRMAAGWVGGSCGDLAACVSRTDTGKPCIDRVRAAAASGSTSGSAWPAARTGRPASRIDRLHRGHRPSGQIGE
jgi:hypothetical protein